MDCDARTTPTEARNATPAKDALVKTPNMSPACMRVFLDIDEMIHGTCKDHARRYPYDPLVRVIERRRWTADRPGAVDLVAMHIDWRSDCRHMIAHTTLHHCQRMLSRCRAGTDCRAVLSAHVTKEDGATKAWLQLHLEPVGESLDAPVDDAMACETLPLPEPVPHDRPQSPSLASSAPSADAKPPRSTSHPETLEGRQSVLHVLGLYPDLSTKSRKTLAALVQSVGHLACEWVAKIDAPAVSTIVVTTSADVVCVAQRLDRMIRMRGRIFISVSCQPLGGVTLTIAPTSDDSEGAIENAQETTTILAPFILPKPEPVDAVETTDKPTATYNCEGVRHVSGVDTASGPLERAVPCAAVPPAQSPVDIIALYPTMTMQDAGHVFAAENQLTGVAHHWVVPNTLVAMRAKSISVSLRATPAAVARAVSEHAGLRDGTKKMVLALCKDTPGSPRVLCAIVDVLPGPETQSPIQVAALYPHLALCDAIVVGALEARLCALPHVWVARWPNGFPSQRARLAPDMPQTLNIADLLRGGMADQEGAWLVLSLERTDDNGDLWLCYGRASLAQASA
nr:hypothetical protein [Pandoravirus massiliensis]